MEALKQEIQHYDSLVQHVKVERHHNGVIDIKGFNGAIQIVMKKDAKVYDIEHCINIAIGQLIEHSTY